MPKQELLFQVQRNERSETATVEVNFEAPEDENPRDSITVEVDDSEPTDVFGLIISRALEEAGFEAYSSPDNHDWAHVKPRHGVYAEPDEHGDFENWFEVTLTAKAVANTETARIRKEVEALLSTLDELVPHTTIHYAVEDARRALRTLAREADTIHTNETNGGLS